MVKVVLRKEMPRTQTTESTEFNKGSEKLMLRRSPFKVDRPGHGSKAETQNRGRLLLEQEFRQGYAKLYMNSDMVA